MSALEKSSQVLSCKREDPHVVLAALCLWLHHKPGLDWLKETGVDTGAGKMA